jgi:hypothetical protein
VRKQSARQSREAPEADEPTRREERAGAPPRDPAERSASQDEEPDEGWNGPVPCFLGQGCGS